MTVDEAVERGGAEAADLLLALLRAPGADVVTVGVGPLEDLLHRHGDAVVDDVVRASDAEPLLGRALAVVDLPDGVVSQASHRRLERCGLRGR